MWLMVRHWPQSLEGDWARPHLYKLTWHGPWPVWKLFIRDHVWRGKSKPGYQIVGSVTTVWLTSDHRSRQPVLSPLRNRVNICRVWPYWVSRCKLWRWMLKDISIHRPIWMGFIGLKHTVSCCFTPQRRRCNTAEHWQPSEMHGLQAAWNQAHWTMMLGVDEICVAGSSPHWTVVFCDWVA